VKDVHDVVIIGSDAGDAMMAYMLTRAGARVAVVEGGGRNIDRDIRYRQWTWELPYRGQYRHDQARVRLPVKNYIVNQGERTPEIAFGRSADFFVKLRDWP